jgi:integration host factor subunit beta
MPTITKKELGDRVAGITQTTQTETKRVIGCFLEEIIAQLARGNRLEFRDFGVFEIKTRAARTSRNPKTLEPVEVPARPTVRFKMGRLMKQKLEGKPLPPLSRG